jgi:hypothetical protein
VPQADSWRRTRTTPTILELLGVCEQHHSSLWISIVSSCHGIQWGFRMISVKNDMESPAGDMNADQAQFTQWPTLV